MPKFFSKVRKSAPLAASQILRIHFGTIKAWMGATHFKMKRMENVATEMALHVLAYNMMRVMAILGVPGLVSAMRA